MRPFNKAEPSVARQTAPVGYNAIGNSRATPNQNYAMNRRTFLGVAAAGLALTAKGIKAAPIAPPPRPPPPRPHARHRYAHSPVRSVSPGWRALSQREKPGARGHVQDHPALALPPIAEPLGIVGAIEIECSSWLEDNQWVLDVAEKDDIMVGTIGHLTPGTPDFKSYLDRFHKNPLFRGIRYGLGRQQGKECDRPEFVADLKYLADADLVMDTANPTWRCWPMSSA